MVDSVKNLTKDFENLRREVSAVDDVTEKLSAKLDKLNFDPRLKGSQYRDQSGRIIAAPTTSPYNFAPARESITPSVSQTLAYNIQAQNFLAAGASLQLPAWTQSTKTILESSRIIKRVSEMYAMDLAKAGEEAIKANAVKPTVYVPGKTASEMARSGGSSGGRFGLPPRNDSWMSDQYRGPDQSFINQYRDDLYYRQAGSASSSSFFNWHTERHPQPWNQIRSSYTESEDRRSFDLENADAEARRILDQLINAATVNGTFGGISPMAEGSKDFLAASQMSAVIAPDLSKQIEKIREMGKVANLTEKEIGQLVEKFVLLASEPGTDLSKISSAMKQISIDAKSMSRDIDVEKLQMDPRYKYAFAKVASKDKSFTPETLKSVSEESSSGISRLTFSYRDYAGVVHTATAATDRFGNTMIDTQRRFRGFGDALVRDIVEVTKWSVAVAVVYAPMQKLQEVVKQSIENQTALADVIVAVGKSQADVNAIFQASVDIAQQTGQALTGVIEGYSLAYRVTGNYSDATERAAVANKLMVDSIILSKLSGMEQSTALDTLSASLRQVGMGLDQGRSLLDLWVKTSKIANVDLNTLATGFSILGDASESAGMNVEELNALIAVVAETSPYAGREAANAARALVGSFQSDLATKTLQQFGVATTDSTGKAREFLEVYKEIADLSQQGLISDDQMQKIASALGGGGVRRAATVQAVLSNMGRMNQIVAGQADANGEAQEALSIKLDIVASSSQRLSNAFQELAQNVGTKGGVLDLMQVMLNVGTSLTTVFSGLVGSMGKAGTVLLPILAAFAYMKTRTAETRLGTLNSVKSFFNDPRYFNIGSQTTGGKWVDGVQQPDVTTTSVGRMFGGLVNANTPGTEGYWGGRSMFTRGATGLALGGVAAAGNLYAASQATTSQERNIAYARAAGDVFGAVVGGVLGGPIGAMAGAAIGESIAATLADYKNDFAKFFVPPEAATGGSSTSAMSDLERQQKQVEDKIFADMGFGNKNFGQFIAKIGAGIASFSSGSDITAQQFAAAGQFDVLSGQPVGNNIKEIQRLYQYTKQEGETETAYTQGALSKIYEANQAIIESIYENINQDLLNQLNQGKIGVSAQSRAAESLTGYTTSFPKWYNAMGQGGQLGSPTEAFSTIGNVMAYGQAETVQRITQYITEVETLTNDIAAAKEAGLDYSEMESRKNEILARSIALTKEVNQEILSQAQGYQTVTGMEKFGKADAGSVVAEATRLYDEWLKAQLQHGGLKADEVKARKEKLVDVILPTANGYEHFRMPEGAVSYVNQAQSGLQESGKISEQNPSNIGLSAMGYTTAQWNQAASMYASTLAQAVSVGYTPQEEEQVVKLTDSQFFSDKKDWKIMQLLLSQIAENTDKGLEGIYNLPEGAHFYFPETAIPKIQASDNGGTSGGAGGVPSTTPGGSKGNPYDMEIPSANWTKEDLEAMGYTGFGTTPEPVETEPPAPSTAVNTSSVSISDMSRSSGGARAGYVDDQGRQWVRDRNGNWILASDMSRGPAGSEIGASGYSDIHGGSYYPPTGYSSGSGASWGAEARPWDEVPVSNSDNGLAAGITDDATTQKNLKAIWDSIINFFTGNGLTSDEQAGAIRGASQGGAPMAGYSRLPGGGYSNGNQMTAANSNLEMAAAAGMGNLADINSLINVAVNAAVGGVQGGGSSMRGKMVDTSADLTSAGGTSTGQDLSKIFEKLNTTMNFKLNLTTRTQLIVDGRTLANVIKPYLSEDLLKAESTVGSFVRDSVI